MDGILFDVEAGIRYVITDRTVNGGEAARHESSKLIALTAYSDKTHVRLSQEAGFDYNFVKPPDFLEIKRLMDILNEILGLTGKGEDSAN
jgi:hypothetical protein